MDIHQLLKYSIGSVVSYSRTGGGASSIWLIQLENSASLWINCAWRIEHENVVLATENDDATAVTGRMAKSVKRLEGYKLLDYELSLQNDLTLFFEKNYCARIFANISPLGEKDEMKSMKNWEYCVADWDICVCATNHFHLISQKYY